MAKKTEQELLDSYKNRIKKQNNAIKDKYDRVSATLPKGTIDRINTLGLSINGVINQSVLMFLEQAEKENDTCHNFLPPVVENNGQNENCSYPQKELYNSEVVNMTPEEVNAWIKQKTKRKRRDAQAGSENKA